MSERQWHIAILFWVACVLLMVSCNTYDLARIRRQLEAIQAKLAQEQPK